VKFPPTNLASQGKTPSVLEICYFTISTFFRIRAQALWNSPPIVNIEDSEGAMASIVDAEVQHCATVIAAAFLNPSKLN
jgi:hypothetical protein